jgi:mannose-6-phosphate isomerase-like protein (cupin superfamily)
MDYDAPIRRIVTTHDASGNAVFLSDGPAQRVGQPGRPVNWPMWVIDTAPAICSGSEDFAFKMKGLQPDPGSTLFRVVDFPPINPDFRNDNPRSFIESEGLQEIAAKSRPPRHPRMHRTGSVDFGLILSGEIDLMLDEETRHLNAGDVVVMQATNHAWINHGTEPCRIAFILIDAKDPL